MGAACKFPDEFNDRNDADPKFITGIEVEAETAHVVSLVAWVDLPKMEERRIVVRMGMSIDVAEKLYLDLWRVLRHAKRRPVLPKSS